jgi:hypothetical protein
LKVTVTGPKTGKTQIAQTAGFRQPSLNPHFHFHVLVIDGVFAPDAEGEVQFYEALRLSDDDVAAAEAAVRRRVLQCFERRGWLEPDGSSRGPFLSCFGHSEVRSKSGEGLLHTL